MGRQYDLIVIGAGPGGYVAAIKAAKAGLKTAVIENRRVGGTCLNRGCIPAKAMIHASSLYREALEGSRFGVHAQGAVYDYPEILAYKQETIDGLVGGVEQLLQGNGVDLIVGTGTLEAPEDGENVVTVHLPKADAGEDAGDAAASGSASDAASDILRLTAPNVILATGSRPAQIPVPGLDLPHVVDSDGLFALEKAPRSLIIIGGGVIGVEFATVFANLGTKVTIVEALPKLLDNFDKEISQNLKMILKKRGVEAHLNAAVKECRTAKGDAEMAGDDYDTAGDAVRFGDVVFLEDAVSLSAADTDANTDKDIDIENGPSEDPSAEGVTVVFEEKGKEQKLSAEYVLVAAGRRPVTEGLFGDGVLADPAHADTSDGSIQDGRIQMNGKFVAVDAHFRTSMPGVYAIGDLTGGIQLAHAASAHGIRVIEEIISAGTEVSCATVESAEPAFAQNIDAIPAGVYTDPEIAQVGITEAQAKEQGTDVSIGKFIMTANGKSLITKEERGFIKVVADTASHRILGAQMMCARATDMIEEFTTAIVNGLTVEDMLRAIRPHPTYNEGIGEALEDVFGESLHTVPRRRR